METRTWQLWNWLISKYLFKWMLAHYCYCCNPLIVFLCPCSPHIVIIVPHRSPLLLFFCPYNIIVMSNLIILWPLRLLYIERRSYHLYHPRIVHLCNVNEVSHSKRLIWKLLIYLFFYFLSYFHNTASTPNKFYHKCYYVAKNIQLPFTSLSLIEEEIKHHTTHISYVGGTTPIYLESVEYNQIL